MAGGARAESGRGKRVALIVASNDYQDPGLTRLRAPAADAAALAAVLSDPEIGGFEVQTLMNEPTHVVNEVVEDFLTDRGPEDLLLLHFSCHGIKDQEGELYFAMANTKLRLLGATAVAANFVNRRMTQSRSHRIVLFLDCCYAGAFDRGMTPRATKVIDLEERFSGRGRAVITASGAVEYAFEGGELTESGDPAPSVFTSAMVRGLTTGEADRDQDGYVDLDELYDYVYDEVRAVTPHQTPGKWTFGVQGDLVIARRGHPVTEPSTLPPDLQHSLDSPLAGVRAGAVGELARLLNGRHQGLALAARQTLEQMTDDDSRTVAAAATAALDAAGTTPPALDATPLAPAVPTRSARLPAPAAATPTSEPPGGTRSTWSRWRPSSTRRRILLALVAAVLLVGGWVAWRSIGTTDPPSTTIPKSFDGQWRGTGTTAHGTSTFTASLGEGLGMGRLDNDMTSCYSGPLTVANATDSTLSTRFAPGNPDCIGSVVFTHLSNGDLEMKVDPDSTLEQEFAIRLSRAG